MRLTSDKVVENRCTEKIIYLNYPELTHQLERGNIIYISDGQVKLKAEAVGKIFECQLLFNTIKIFSNNKKLQQKKIIC